MKQRKSLLVACAALAIAAGIPAARAADIAVNLGGISIDFDFGPPPPRYEPLPPPRFGHVWAPGYWRAAGHHHEWVPGRWIEARRDHAWVADRWVPVGSRWHYEPGHWERHSAAYGPHGRHEDGSWHDRDGERHGHYQ